MEAGALAGAVLFVLNVLGMVWQPKQVFFTGKGNIYILTKWPGRTFKFYSVQRNNITYF